jgi:hypothetical protein
MSTTQRNDSINKFFKDYIHSSTMVHEFVHQYEKALDARYMKEKEKDVKTKTFKPILKTCYKMKVQTANIYPRNSFLMFQEELLTVKNTIHLNIEKNEVRRYIG